MTPQASFAKACDDVFGVDAPARVGVAVSGGSDSTALLVLACAHFGPGRVAAVSVDHRLRAGAAAELAQVGHLCVDLGCSHEVLAWQGWDGQGNLQAEARAARYRLMAHWAAKTGLENILLGHTADDQAETVLLRLARGSGVDGLAAMQKATLRDGIRWIRPLLAVGRDELCALLKVRQIPWSNDPSNDDPGFDRIRLRQMMPELAKLGLDRERLSQTADHMARARSALRQATRALAAQIVTQEAGDLVIARAGFEAAPEEIRTRLLAEALCFVSGQTYRPRYAALAALAAHPEGTLHGARITVSMKSLRITREWAALREVQSSPDALFDGRWKLTGPTRAGEVVRALGEAGLAECEDRLQDGLPRASLLASPAIWRGETLVAAPLAQVNPGWSAELSGNRADFLAYLPQS